MKDASIFRLLDILPDGSVNAPYAKMPFDTMLITGPEEERGALILVANPDDWQAVCGCGHEHRCSHEDDGTPATWHCLALYVGRDGVLAMGLCYHQESGRMRVLVFEDQDAESVHHCNNFFGREVSGIESFRKWRLWAESESPAGDTRLNMYNRALFTVATTLSLLNCRNVSVVVHDPPGKLQRHRRRAGLHPGYRFHTLQVRPRGGHRDAGGGSERPEPLSLHWVRGHFKEFTAEKPLFGHHTGLYWWGPHLAGSKAAGIVVKDYALSQGAAVH